MAMPIINEDKRRPKRRIKSFMRILTTVAVVVGIFYGGWAVGQGRLVLGKDAVYKKTVNPNLAANLDYTGVEQVYDSLRTNFDGKIDPEKLKDGIKEGVAKAAGDPYTEYFNVKAAKAFNEQLSGTFAGIGAELGKDPTNNAIIVIAPIAGLPAEKAGMRSKDIIAEIDGKSALDLSISEAVSKIRGPAGTNVKLKLIRDGSQAVDLDITRQDIKIPSVTSKTLDGNIGYIKIDRYSDDTTKLATEAANKFKANNIKGMVLDVRGDPGGLLDAAVDISSLWLNNKTVLTERRDGAVIKTYSSHTKAPLEGIPTVLLMDSGSASASEITAGALKDNGAATLMGTKSYGKGSVQQLINFNDGTFLKVTIARWYTPAGKNIDKEGIAPDVEVKRTEEDFKNNTDPQLNAAIDKLK